jgi:hypothetical protein
MPDVATVSAQDYADEYGIDLDADGYLPPGFRGKYKEPFVYTVNFLPIAGASGVLSATTNINNDSWFACVAQTALIVDSATHNTTFTAPTVAAILISLGDSSSGKQMCDAPVHIALWFGTALQPFVWLRRARLYRGGGQIQVSAQNVMAASQDLRLAFIGFKIYAMPDIEAQM